MVRFTANFSYAQLRVEVISGWLPVAYNFVVDVQAEIRQRIGKPGRSRRGEPPARRSGRLYNDMEIVPLPLGAQLNINAPYAIYLEPPGFLDRPFAQVSVDDVRQRFTAIGI